MLYLNQLDYEDIEYNTNVDNGGMPEGKNNIRFTGCGLCSLCMVVDHLTFDYLSLEECRDLSVQFEANLKPGTDLKILAPVIAEKLGLLSWTTNDKQELLEHLRYGGVAIANVGGDREGYVGVFSHGGHYITVISTKGDELCIIDPSLQSGKYDDAEKANKVRLDKHFIYCDANILMDDCSNRDPRFYLFSR